MGFDPRLAPYSHTYIFAHDPGADERFTLFRFPTGGQVLTAFAVNTAAIATVTDTLALHLVKLATNAAETVQGTLGSWAAGVAWATDTEREMVKTSFGSTALFAPGEKLSLFYDEEGDGIWTEMGFQVDYILGYENGVPPVAATGPA